MGFYPVEILAACEAIVDKLIEKKDSFPEPLQSVDLDELWGLATDESEIPLPCVVVEPTGGDLDSEAFADSISRQDLHRIRVLIFSEARESGKPRSASIAMLAKLAEIFRSEEFTDFLVLPETQQVLSLRAVSYEPNNSFIESNIFGWSLNLELALSSSYSSEEV